MRKRLTPQETAEQLQPNAGTMRDCVQSDDQVLLPEGAAKMLCVGVSTLGAWRCRGVGPAYIKLPGRMGAVRYYRSDIEQFLAQYRVTPSVRANVREKLDGQ